MTLGQYNWRRVPRNRSRSKPERNPRMLEECFCIKLLEALPWVSGWFCIRPVYLERAALPSLFGCGFAALGLCVSAVNTSFFPTSMFDVRCGARPEGLFDVWLRLPIFP